MRAVMLLAVALTFAFVLSGCLEGGSSPQGTGANGRPGADAADRIPIGEGWSELALTTGSEHDHLNHTQHADWTTPNFEVLGWNPLITDYHGRTAGGYLCGDAVDRNGRRLSVVHSFTTDVAFIITDVTDPRNPQKIGEFVMANTHVYDLALTQDQRTVLLATSPGTNSIGNDPSGDRAAPRAAFRDSCTGQERPVLGPEQGLPFASGIVVVDISNPRAPAITDFRFFPVNGGHSVQTRDLMGRVLVLVSVPNGGLPTVGNPAGFNAHSYFVFAELVGGPTDRRLDVLSVYQYAALATAVPGVRIPGNVHDGYMQRHPVTGQHLAYLAYGTSGLVIVNIDDPRSPRFLSYWGNWNELGEAGQNTHFQHETLPLEETWDGRHYTFMGEECGAHPPKSPTCLAYAFDTTDPTKPKLVGAWTLPHDVQWNVNLQYSLHYLGLVNRTLFVTVYHGGLWAVDVSHLGAQFSLPSIGVFMPPHQSPKPARGVPYTPRVNDLISFVDGTMAVYDAYTGVYLVRFDASNPAPAPEPWPLGPAP